MSDQFNTKLGPYKLHSTLGQGASSVVYRAYDTDNRREVAIKILAATSDDDKSRERFARAAELWGTIDSPNVVKVLGHGEYPGHGPYLVMEYVRGQDLDKVLQAGALGFERAVAIGRQLIKALMAAHAADVLHRDIKPGNILLGDEDVVKVTDFGLAKNTPTLSMDDALEPLTAHGQLLGTPRYMAPEQVDPHAVCPATDIYSTGLVLYEMMTGRAAAEGDSIQKLLLRHLDSDPIVNPLDPDVPEAFREVIARATSKSLVQRYGYAEEFLIALDGALARYRSEGDVPSMTVGLPTSSTGFGLAPITKATETSASENAPEPRFVAGVVRGGERGKPKNVVQSQSRHKRKPTKPPKSWKERGQTAVKLFVVCAVLLSIALVGAWLAQDWLIFKKPKIEPKIYSQTHDELKRLGWVRKDLTSASGETLVGYFGAAKSLNVHGAVLYLHDLYAFPAKDALRIDHLRNEGLHVFVLAQRGYGESKGKPSSVGDFVSDSIKALDLLTVLARTGGKNLYVYGRGFGASTAAELSVRRPKMAGLILEAPPISLAHRVDQLFLGLPVSILLKYPFDTKASLGKSKVPRLLIHGEDNTFIPFSHSEELYKIGGAVKALRAVPGAGHDDLIGRMGNQGHAMTVSSFMGR